MKCKNEKRSAYVASVRKKEKRGKIDAAKAVPSGTSSGAARDSKSKGKNKSKGKTTDAEGDDMKHTSTQRQQVFPITDRDLRVIFSNVLSASQPLDQEMRGSLRLHMMAASSSSIRPTSTTTVTSTAEEAAAAAGEDFWLSFEGFAEALLAAACFCEPNPFSPHDIKFRTFIDKWLLPHAKMLREIDFERLADRGDVLLLASKKLLER